MSDLEETLAWHIYVNELPVPVREYEFAKELGRKWRADFAWREPYKLLVECEGGTWSQGRHTRGGGFRNDCEKQNAAVLLGYRVLRFTKGMITSGAAVETIKQALEQGGE